MSKITIQDKIAKLAEKTGKDKDDLHKEFQEVLKELRKANKNISEDVVFQRLKGSVERETGTILSPAVWYTGVFFGDTGIVDFVDLMIKKAENRASNPFTKKEAVRQGIIDSDGTPLDTRKQVDFQDNPNYGKPLDRTEHAYDRVRYGIASKGQVFDPNTAEFFRLNARDAMALIEDVPYMTEVKFRANMGRRPPEGYLSLNVNENLGLVLQETGGSTEYDYSEIIRNGKWNAQPLDQIEFVHSSYCVTEEGKRTKTPILVEAYVRSVIEPKENKKGRISDSITLAIDDETVETGILCFLRKTVPIRFGLDSKILLVGQIDKTTRDEEERYVFRADGYCPIKGYILPI